MAPSNPHHEICVHFRTRSRNLPVSTDVFALWKSFRAEKSRISLKISISGLALSGRYYSPLEKSQFELQGGSRWGLPGRRKTGPPESTVSRARGIVEPGGSVRLISEGQKEATMT